MVLGVLQQHTLDDTLVEIERLATDYAQDVIDYVYMKPSEFFTFVKQIKYVKDPKGKEFVKRPKYTIEYNEGDCDDKTVVCLAYFKLKNIPCGYSIVGNKDFYHHIFPFVIANGKKIDYDATYSNNKLGERKDWLIRKDYIFIEE
jgi:hypothetical protein